MFRNRHAIVAIVAATLLATPVMASDGDTPPTRRHHATKAKKTKNPAINAYIKANEKMHRDMDIIYSGNADIDFARGMIPHHQGAVDMAEVVLQYGDDAEIKELAQRIIVWQEAEIGMMKQWLLTHDSTWQAEHPLAMQSVKGYVEAMNIMHRDMNIDYTGDADVDFARGMIPHHQGAVDMADVLVAFGVAPMLRSLSHDIVRSQGQEIRLMQEWLEKQPPLPIVKKKSTKKHHGHHG